MENALCQKYHDVVLDVFRSMQASYSAHNPLPSRRYVDGASSVLIIDIICSMSRLYAYWMSDLVNVAL